MIRVLLVDDHALVRTGFRLLLHSHPATQVVGEADSGEKCGVASLSERDFEVFLRLAAGHTVQRIAEDLKLSASTVGTHLYNVKQKLGASNQAELTLIAIRHRLIEP